jgi:PAP2 superfamily
LIGFDWMAAFDAAQRHPVVAQGLRLAYTSLLPFTVVALIYAAIRDPARAKALLAANAATLAIVLAVSAVWPAGSAFRFFSAPVEIAPDSYIGRFEAARAGSWALHLSGIIAFPSYHAALATLVAFAVPNPIVIAMSAAIIAAAPTVGGHYLVDIIAGVTLAVALWLVCVRRLRTAQPRA